ncbi:hypothetical protein BCR35DRAFT_333689 [Leucosporidium creatinivorum]|uniref:NAD-dependent epimerase/dehydratase domain-containing protein n=1 Tax=Leucosporidium creatinivorum TaxID=106004 RepID=A0A1Y2ERG2_9BASI|nr:hypothetical protein BCR35DRAFT_333689 [Leucosporidium creatinivorum]
MATKTVLVTGASGFLASYVIESFLENGWAVRGTVRSKAKAQHLLDRYPDGSKLTLVEDIVTGEGLAEALEGCDAVAHTASPYALTVVDPMKDFITPAVEGTLSVLRAAKAAGIKRVVVTSSFAAVTNLEKGGPWRDYTYTAADWNPTTLEQAVEAGRPGPFVYSASKTLAEHAAQDYGAENDLEVRIHGTTEVNTSSNAIYTLINGATNGEVPWNRLPLFVAVEDVALAHVRALEVDGAKVKGQRFLLCGGGFTWEDAIKHLQKVRPELASRLPKLPEVEKDFGPMATMDCTPAREILGLPEFKTWPEVLERTIDSLVEVEKSWSK